ncbi:YutD family protein [Hutsoniella sourekii]|uniref:YutD family protein n=1 Tax=Hutsoniella sourekii TaxID=87650 RepID=UPI0004B205E0|nr:YutD family protein [Hutsoniella sourekii]
MTKQTQTNQIDQELSKALEELTQNQSDLDYHISRLDDSHVSIEDQDYQLVANYREGFDLEAFKGRYDDYFSKYDYIVGDWGHDQLRLRGFYQINYRKASKDRQINYVVDYLREYCNFGCAYFILGKDQAVAEYPEALDHYLKQLEQGPSHKPSSKRKKNNKRSAKRNSKRPSVKGKNNESSRSNKHDHFQINTDNKKKTARSVETVRTKTKHKGSFIIKKKG